MPRTPLQYDRLFAFKVNQDILSEIQILRANKVKVAALLRATINQTASMLKKEKEIHDPGPKPLLQKEN